MGALRNVSARRVGWFVLAVLLGFGAGNYHATKAAVDGSSQWWARHERRHLTAQQQADYNTCYQQWQALNETARN